MISVIIVDYKSIEKTISYIENFKRNIIDNFKYNFIIVDNSPDNGAETYLSANSKSIVQKRIESDLDLKIFKLYVGDICYCYSGSNLGYAKGNNLGAKIATALYRDDFYIISNNDLGFKNKFNFSTFMNIYEQDNQIAVIGPRILGLDSKDQSPYKKISVNQMLMAYPWTRFWPFRSSGDLNIMDRSDYCYRVMGCFMIIKASAFNAVDGFDPNTFMYGEEMILSERMNSKDFKTYFYIDYEIIHEHGVTVKNTSSILQADKWLFDSLFYYCKEYRNASKLFLKLASINRILNKLVVSLKENIKRCFVKNSSM